MTGVTLDASVVVPALLVFATGGAFVGRWLLGGRPRRNRLRRRLWPRRERKHRIDVSHALRRAGRRRR